MELAAARSDGRRKRIILIAFSVFAGLLAIMTLFGNTLQSLTLPKVRTEQPVRGSLAFTLEAGGRLEPYSEAELPNPAGWKVRKVRVKTGERVKKGQLLVTYDGASAARELEDERSFAEKQNIELQNAQDQFILTSAGGDALEIRKAKRAIESLKLDLGAQQRKIADLTEKLAAEREIRAPFDGTVTQVNAVEGLASSGEPDIRIANGSLGYRLAVTADRALIANLGLTVGKRLDVEVHTVQGQRTRIVAGTIDELEEAPLRAAGDDGANAPPIPMQVVKLKLADAGLQGGEEAKLALKQPSPQSGLLVSNAAIHRDGNGAFVYVVEERRGALGNVFAARQVRIQEEQTNGVQTMIQSDLLSEDERIVLESGEPLQDGNRVRLQ
ncbi:efflux RND transporter periplasmic adaptor subunit [Paenibacillus glycinis]|uniref:RND transporter n=1 Tax=Paenibacillus glycinis TaxID=2697035 RepID=A0ABW9XKQ6_9BACL|nr:RND transporter [Paenibacillus glycinis]NBD23184.1 RND transporter [Paenibacillus glycinis]